MERYDELTLKLGNDTITEVEKDELFTMAFGEVYMKSRDKGTLKEYKEL